MKRKKMMRITVLNDNQADGPFFSEPGLSYLVESGKTFLFDTGPSDVICRNAALLNINLNLIKTIVVSHGHYDHANGLEHLNGQELICHPDVFNKHFRKNGGSFNGMSLSREEAEAKFNIICTKEPYYLSENVAFLGEIPRVNDFEARTTGFQDEAGNDDFIPDDSGVAIKTENGLVILSGCAHSGICNMVSHAINCMNEKKVFAVIGGFHLKELNDQVRRTIGFLRSLNVEKIIPAHCTEVPALDAFNKVWPFDRVRSGQVMDI